MIIARGIGHGKAHRHDVQERRVALCCTPGGKIVAHMENQFIDSDAKDAVRQQWFFANLLVEGVLADGAIVTYAPLLESVVVRTNAGCRGSDRENPPEVGKLIRLWCVGSISQGHEQQKSEPIIAREKLVKVRVATEDAVNDMASGFFFLLFFPQALGILLPQTVIVQGNRAPEPVGTN